MLWNYYNFVEHVKELVLLEVNPSEIELWDLVDINFLESHRIAEYDFLFVFNNWY